MFKWIVCILISSMILSGCLPADSARSAGSGSSSPNSNNNEPPVIDTSEIDFVVGVTASKNPNIEPTIANPVFLRGGSVNKFFDQTANINTNIYCLILNFEKIVVDPSLGTQDNRQLRVRATTGSTIDHSSSTSSTLSYFQLNFNDSNLNEASCKGDFDNYSSATIPNKVFYSAQSLCPNCTTTINANKISLVTSLSNNSGTPPQLAQNTNLISTNGLSFSINRSSSNSNDSGGSSSGNQSTACSAQNCTQAGFCCSNESNACVQHASVKPGFEGTAELAQALTLIDNDPSQLQNFSAIFHICPNGGNNSGSSGNSSGGSSDNSAGNQTISQLRIDLPCAEELRANALAEPYHLSLNPTPPSCDSSTPGSCQCLYDSSQSNEPLYYLNVMDRLYGYCNCPGESFSEKSANCPNAFFYNIQARDSQGQPTQVICSAVEQPEFDPNVTLSSKSVPHRFYTQAGLAIDDIGKAAQGTTQEGEAFSYIGSNKIFPNNSEFNMNSVLGSMNIDLTGSLPAKAVSVVAGQSYIIRNEGNDSYIPCTDCPSDSWFSPFRAYPIANMREGLGLRAYGHTTRRDSNENNRNLGNYEDRIWGRACFIPPTMLPFSHKTQGISSVNDARKVRLQTQAAMFINGYQRDWFGFNYGATIGSFDGVSWFAIGRSRLVQAKSDTLYLAFNAPFGDLATPNIHRLTVQPFIQGSSASNFDYDPSAPNDNLKNQGASCQQYHICKTDTDCVTQLGWEYVCASATASRTQWPSFQSTNENLRPSSARTIVGILQQSSLPALDTNKRCVYRGAGSPCVVNTDHVFDEQLRRSLTCAPNFHCASPSSTAFNKEVARFAAPLAEIAFLPNNHVFGQDANILGRPLDYVSSNLSQLPAIVSQTLKENILTNNVPGITRVDISAVVGLCRPGRELPPIGVTINETNDNLTASSLNSFPSLDPLRSQSRPNLSGATDYISQIAMARDQEYSDFRYISCPVIDPETKNYLHFSSTLYDKGSGLASFMRDFKDLSALQNITSDEALNPSGNSPFEQIEGLLLSGNQLIADKTLTKSACLRRAGAVCHTDLDCGPGRLHKPFVSLGDEYFGNPAEKAYYQESLICAQGESKPTPGFTNFNTFDITKNRCCREKGETLTIYSSDTPSIDFELETKTLSHLNYQDEKRYSRLSARDTELNASMERDSTSGIVDLLRGDRQGQWQTIHNVAKRTCCGGGWVRKFSDGSHDWNSPVELNIEPTNFRCLNYRTPIASYTAREMFDIYGVSETITNTERSLQCASLTSAKDPACSQESFPSLDVNDLTPPKSLINVTNQDPPFTEMLTVKQGVNFSPTIFFAPYKARLGTLSPGTSPNFTRNGVATDSQDIFRAEDGAIPPPDSIVANNIVLPAYVPRKGVASNSSRPEFEVFLIEDTDGAAEISCGSTDLDRAGVSTTARNEGIIFPPPANSVQQGTDCRFRYDQDLQILVIEIPNLTSTGDVSPLINEIYTNQKQYAIGFKFTPPGTYQPLGSPAPVGSGQYGVNGLGSEPGSQMFYLNRLGRMELSGIPQVFHEAIYCNDNQVKLVPGLYRDDLYNNDQRQRDYFTPSTGPNINDSPLQASQALIVNATPPSLSQGSHITPSAIEGAENAPTDVPGGQFITSYKGLGTQQVFSEHEFACCQRLGTFATNESLCCSGYGVPVPNSTTGDIQCRLPVGTNLNVYFNRFVSGESDGDVLTQNDLNLTDDDFIPTTGEPDISKDTVVTKLKNLAVQFCSNSSWRTGSAFGDFAPQPTNLPVALPAGSFTSIVDSSIDRSAPPAGNSGGINTAPAPVDYQAFQSGFRWNHHIYCN